MKRLGFAVIVALVIAVIALSVQVFVLQPEPTASGPTPAPSASVPPTLAPEQAAPRLPRPPLKLTEAKGRIERRLPDGSWKKVSSGDVLNEKDVLRTGKGASGKLKLGEGVTIDIGDETTFELAELGAMLSRITLEDGRLVPTLEAGAKTALQVGVKGSDAVAETKSGTFAVMKRGSGPVTVAATDGQVVVTAHGGKITIRGGQQSIVEAGSPPSPPTEIPASLFVKLGNAAGGQQREKTLTVSGTTVPGAVVRVGGQRVNADAKGNFSGEVALEEGRNDLEVEVEDALGRNERAKLGPVVVDSKPPRVKGAVKW